MPRNRTPLTPIFDVKTQFGGINTGNTPGTSPLWPNQFLPPAILLLNPLSYWTLRNDNANTLYDFGSLQLDLTNQNVFLNSELGEDGFNYPDSSINPSPCHLVGSDDINYEPQTASGLTVMFFIKATGDISGLTQPVNKTDQSGDGSWRMGYGNIQTFARTITAGGATARTRDVGAALGNADWNSVIVRFLSLGTDFPSVRVNGANITGTTSGSGTGNSNSPQPIRLFGHGGNVSHPNCSLAHVAIFAGQLSDGNCTTIETAAIADGWTF